MQNPLNCWDTPKPYVLKRKDEINLGANATKVKRNIRMA